MVNPKNKKRQSVFTSEETKQKQQKVDKEPNNDSLFDDLDEEMDPELMDDFMEQLNDIDENDDNSVLMDSNDEDSEESVASPEEESEESGEETDDNKVIDQPMVKKNLSSKFRDHYMEKITVAFGSDLDQIRQDSGLNSSRLNVLIDSLETGMDVFSELEKDIMLTEAKK